MELPQPAQRGARREHFYALIGAANVPREDERGRSLDVHALRDTAATRMLRFGVPYQTVAKTIGHSDLSVLLRHYEDLSPEDVAADLRRVPEAIPGTKWAHPAAADVGSA